MTDPTARDLIQRLADLADALDGRKRLVSSQGQALDGFTALANFRAIADEARAYLAAPDGPAEPSDDELLELMPETMRDEFAYAATVCSDATGGQVNPGIFRVALNTAALEYGRAVLARCRCVWPNVVARNVGGDCMADVVTQALDDGAIRVCVGDHCGTVSSWHLVEPKANQLAQQHRQDRLDARYDASGRAEPTHPFHNLYTGLSSQPLH